MATSTLGDPVITMPLLTVDGLPVGVQIVGQLHDDARLASMVRWMSERLTPVPVGSDNE